MALNFVGGIPFQVLYDVVKLAIRKSNKFKKQLLNLKATLDGLHPLIIQGIEENNARLHLPTETIRGIRAKMVEGKDLIDMMLKLSVWNIRIWGNCNGCMGRDWAEQISELDRELNVLKDRLEMERNKNITDLVVLGKAGEERLDRVEKKLDSFLEGQQQIKDMMKELLKQGRSDSSEASTSGGVRGSPLLDGVGEAISPTPVLGEVFQMLFDISKEANVNNLMYRHLTERLKSTLFYIHPLIEEISIQNKILHLPDEEVKHLLKQLTDGAGLVSKFSKIGRRAKYKENGDTITISDLNCSLQRLITRLIQEVEMKIKRTTDLADKIEAVIKNFKDGDAGKYDDLGAKGGTTSPVTAISIVESRLDQTSNINVVLQQSDIIEAGDGDVEQFGDLGAKGGSASTTAISIVESSSVLTSNLANSQVGFKQYENIEVGDVDVDIEQTDDLRTKGGSTSAKCYTPMGLKQSDKKEEPAVPEHLLKPKGNARIKHLKKWCRRNNSSQRKKKTNEKPFQQKKESYCSCIKSFQEHNEETEMIVQSAFPEECIGTIISLTTPADACRLSLVSKHFKSAADSDQVWEKFFPSPRHILLIESRSASSSTNKPAAKSKKEAYLALCDKQVLVDDRRMSFWLDKWSGKTCYMVCAKELRIAWADGKSENWSWISIAESRFELVALLDSVCWLEIRGKIDLSVLSPRTCYKAYLVYKFTEMQRGFDVPVEVAVAKRDYGFEYGPLDAALAEGKVDQTVYLAPRTESAGVRCPKKRENGWLEMEVGEFRCQAEEDGELEMICAEIKYLGWKSGLIVEGFEVRPERKEYSMAKAKLKNKGKKRAIGF